jgi:preprotein translocase subunit YajC
MQPAQPSALEMMLPFAFIFVIFYFLLIRPQSKRLKEHQKLIAELKRGDQVVTNGGILGVVDSINDSIVSLEIANGVRIKILKKQIAGTQKTTLEAKS